MRNGSVIVLAALAMALGAAGCAKKGPAETAGEKVDDAMAEMRQGGQEAAAEIKEAAQEIKQETQEAAAEVKEEINK